MLLCILCELIQQWCSFAVEVDVVLSGITCGIIMVRLNWLTPLYLLLAMRLEYLSISTRADHTSAVSLMRDSWPCRLSSLVSEIYCAGDCNR